MKKLLPVAAAAFALASTAVLPAAMASTSGTLEGTMSIGYSCDITIPSAATLTPSGTSASGSSLLPYSQNADTQYTLSSLSINGPNGSTLSGSVTFRDGTSSTVVSNSSEASPTSGQVSGNTSGTGSVVFILNETSESAFLSGSYTLSSVLTCSQA